MSPIPDAADEKGVEAGVAAGMQGTYLLEAIKGSD
jgi:hypothetical protein